MSTRLLLPLVPLFFITMADADDCANAMTQGAMNQCAAQENEAADKELNTLYKQITARLKGNAEAKQLLVKAQRAWMGFRDAECRFSASGVEGGSVYPMIHNDCVTAVTKARVQRFKNYLECEEGDLSCPVPGA
ncbi:lysozyme inhibitor LprI family protein [Pseudomonas sp. SAICEU22]|uniref:Lysozyme inhibitor LprI family protein n=1 Tax=Pseudomonas agronomica TaxID=2979328 RepID=A0ABT3FGQ2_9PSED|nr:lysozyme inhibitor LprI family protein [Pseudomonas agronomica]MCW1248268.1 lysozyme inhibitor LprI family protein [Pseudomonas agronomica]